MRPRHRLAIHLASRPPLLLEAASEEERAAWLLALRRQAEDGAVGAGALCVLLRRAQPLPPASLTQVRAEVLDEHTGEVIVSAVSSASPGSAAAWQESLALRGAARNTVASWPLGTRLRLTLFERSRGGSITAQEQSRYDRVLGSATLSLADLIRRLADPKPNPSPIALALNPNPNPDPDPSPSPSPP